jgi:hypothetical protein
MEHQPMKVMERVEESPALPYVAGMAVGLAVALLILITVFGLHI